MPDESPAFDLNDIEFGITLRGHQKGDRVFDRFLLSRQIGRGGMGVVWLAFDELLGREVALKFAPDEIRFDPVAIEELKEETRKGLEMAHPHIVKIYDFLLDEHHAAISMEFIDGEHLGALRAKKPDKIFEPDEIAPWIAQLLDALEYAHDTAQLIHCDLKPANLMIDRDGTLRVTDFGIARSISEAINRATLGSTCAGTLAYMSPQQASGKPPGISDDIYALGSTLYELLTGKPPFYSGDIAQQLQREKPQPLTERRHQFGLTHAKQLPELWEEVVLCCLEKDSARRPPNARAVAVMLGLQGDSITSPRTLARPFRPKRNTLLIASAVSVIAASAAGVLWLRNPKPVDDTPPKEKIIAEAGPGAIQKMIDAANEGDVITIPARDLPYDEALRLKSGVTLKASEKGGVIVETDGKTGSALLAERCTDAHVIGIVFRHSGRDVIEEDSFAVAHLRSSSIQLTDCEFSGGVGEGVWITGGKPKLERCRIHHNKLNGIVCEAGAKAEINGCQIESNGLCGIDVRNLGTAPVIAAGICANNGDSGIVVKDAAGATIKDAIKLEHNGEAGVIAVGPQSSVIIDNALSDGNKMGVSVQEGAAAQVRKFTVRSADTGIHFDGAADGSTIADCTVEGARFNGMLIAGASGTRVSITGTAIRNSSLSSIIVTGASFKADIQRNEFDISGQFGIAIAEGASADVRDNVFREMSIEAIHLQNAAKDVAIGKNTIDGVVTPAP